MVGDDHTGGTVNDQTTPYQIDTKDPQAQLAGQGVADDETRLLEPDPKKYGQITFSEKAQRAEADSGAAGRIPQVLRVRMATTGDVSWVNGVIKHEADAAALLSALKQSPQEHLYAVTVAKE